MYQLKSCVWELTRACSMRCIHCGSQAGLSRERELNETEAVGIADQLIELGCRRVTLIGGEVTLCPYWARLAHYFAEGGVVCDIVTNGYCKTKQDFEAIRASRIVSAALSVDGMETLHNRIRGRKDAFAEADRFCRSLPETGVLLTAVTTITRTCVDQLELLYDWLASRGARSWQWQQISPMGNADGREDLTLRREDVERVFDLYLTLSARGNGPRIYLADNLGYFAKRDGRLLHPFRGCAAGLNVIGLDSVGNVRGCQSLCGESFIEGNLRKTSLREIWESPDSFAYNRGFTPALLTGKCRDCAMGRRCAGGCRSFNAAHGALYEHDNCIGRQLK